MNIYGREKLIGMHVCLLPSDTSFTHCTWAFLGRRDCLKLLAVVFEVASLGYLAMAFGDMEVVSILSVSRVILLPACSRLSSLSWWWCFGYG